MRTHDQVIPIRDELTLPWDLRDWFNQAELRRWITEEIETLDWANPEIIDYLCRHPSSEPKMMLCLLTYAYATAVFGSEEIVRRCHGDGSFRLICAGHPPDHADSIKQFRRENRGLLKWSLTQLFKHAIKARLDRCLLPAGLKSYMLDAAVTRLNVARQIDSGDEGL